MDSINYIAAGIAILSVLGLMYLFVNSFQLTKFGVYDTLLTHVAAILLVLAVVTNLNVPDLFWFIPLASAFFVTTFYFQVAQKEIQQVSIYMFLYFTFTISATAAFVNLDMDGKSKILLLALSYLFMLVIFKLLTRNIKISLSTEFFLFKLGCFILTIIVYLGLITNFVIDSKQFMILSIILIDLVVDYMLYVRGGRARRINSRQIPAR